MPDLKRVACRKIDLRNIFVVQAPNLAAPELATLQPLIDSCFGPALAHRARGRSAPQALDDIALDLLTIAQTNERPAARQFAVETLETLQKLCPMSMAVTLRHFAAIYQAVHAGSIPLQLPFFLGFDGRLASLEPVLLQPFVSVASIKSAFVVMPTCMTDDEQQFLCHILH